MLENLSNLKEIVSDKLLYGAVSFDNFLGSSNSNLEGQLSNTSLITVGGVVVGSILTVCGSYIKDTNENLGKALKGLGYLVLGATVGYGVCSSLK